jgi:tetratricopeptide (TPR) repeat protein
MAIQYAEDAELTGDLSERASALTETESSLVILAQGAYAATQGDVEGTFSLLSPIATGEHAPLANLFIGLAEVRRYELSMAAYMEPVAAPVDVPVDEGVDDGADETGANEGEELQRLRKPRPKQIVEPELGEETAEGDEAGDDGEETAEGLEEPEVIVPVTAQIDEPVIDVSVVENFELAARLDPLLVPARYFRGLVLEYSGDLEAARDAYTEATQLAPEHVATLLRLGQILVDDGQFMDAGRTLVPAVELESEVRSQSERSRHHHLLGLVAASRREFGAAATSFQAAFRVDPSNVEVMWELSELFLETGDYRSAIEFFEENPATGAHADEVVLALSLHRISLTGAGLDDDSDATLNALGADLERGRADHPEDARWVFHLALTRQAQSDFDSAEYLLERSVELDPDYRPAYLALAELAHLSNRDDRALDYLMQAVEHGEPDSAIESRIGHLYLTLDDTAAAAERFNRSIEIDPHNMGARMELVRYHVSQGSERDLIIALREIGVIQRAGVDDGEINTLAAQAEYGLGNLSRAQERIERLQAEGLSSAEQFYLRGRINFDMGARALEAGSEEESAEHFENARADFFASFMQGSEVPESRYWEARAYLALGNAEESVDSLRRAIDEALRAGQPQGEYYYWLGFSLEQTTRATRQDSALEAYALVDRYDLHWALANPEVYYRRGRLFANTYRLTQAKRDLRWALVLDRDHAAAARALAEIYSAEARHVRAIDLWHQSLQINPDQPGIHYRLGTTHNNREEFDLATGEFERAHWMSYGEIEPLLWRILGYLYYEERGNLGGAREMLLLYHAAREAARWSTAGIDGVIHGEEERIEIESILRRLGVDI